MEIKKVGIVGAGIMGSSIAQFCAQYGYEVVVSDISDVILEKCLASIQKTFARLVKQGKIVEQDKEVILRRITTTKGLGAFQDCDLVIEAVTENMKLKKKVFTELDEICPKHCILLSNTSCLSITDIAMSTHRPDKVMGMHFFNPVSIMQLLEVIRTIVTSEDTVNTAKDFGKSLGKTIIVVNDTPGFIVTRLLIPFVLDAIRLVEAGIATPEDIDKAVTLGLNHPMGPLTLADFSGLDTLLEIAEAVYNESKNPQFIPPVLLRKMVTAGRLGRKIGKGFFNYT